MEKIKEVITDNHWWVKFREWESIWWERETAKNKLRRLIGEKQKHHIISEAMEQFWVLDYKEHIAKDYLVDKGKFHILTQTHTLLTELGYVRQQLKELKNNPQDLATIKPLAEIIQETEQIYKDMAKEYIKLKAQLN